ncbi:unnamed protein product [Penicillium pancosmium]
MNESFQQAELVDDWLISRIDDRTDDPNFGLVEMLYETCSAALAQLWKSQFRLMSHGQQKATLKKDVANLRLWDENYSRGYLDIILGNSCHLKVSVAENLKGIGDILLSYLADCEKWTTVTSKKDIVHARDLALDLKAQLERTAVLISSEDSSASSADETSDEASSTAQRERNRLGRLHCYVRCLMDLVPVIENEVYRLQHQVERPSHPNEDVFHLSQSAQPFAMRIRDRFTNAPVYLVERLAEANWERHVRIRAQESFEEDESRPVLFKPGSLFHDSALGSSIPYAATAASHTSFLSVSATGQEVKGRPRVPPLPQKDETYFRYEDGSDEDESTTTTLANIDSQSHSDTESYKADLGRRGEGVKAGRVRAGRVRAGRVRAARDLTDLPPVIKTRQFKCREVGCTGIFSNQESLKRHMKSHSKEKPHICWVPGCNRGFSRSDNLNAHLSKTHSKRAGRNRYVATLDDTSEEYDPDFRGQLTPDGRPIYGSKLDIPGYDDLTLDVDGWDD